MKEIHVHICVYERIHEDVHVYIFDLANFLEEYVLLVVM